MKKFAFSFLLSAACAQRFLDGEDPANAENKGDEIGKAVGELIRLVIILICCTACTTTWCCGMYNVYKLGLARSEQKMAIKEGREKLRRRIRVMGGFTNKAQNDG